MDTCTHIRSFLAALLVGMFALSAMGGDSITSNPPDPEYLTLKLHGVDAVIIGVDIEAGSGVDTTAFGEDSLYLGLMERVLEAHGICAVHTSGEQCRDLDMMNPGTNRPCDEVIMTFSSLLLKQEYKDLDSSNQLSYSVSIKVSEWHPLHRTIVDIDDSTTALMRYLLPPVNVIVWQKSGVGHCNKDRAKHVFCTILSDWLGDFAQDYWQDNSESVHRYLKDRQLHIQSTSKAAGKSRR